MKICKGVVGDVSNEYLPMFCNICIITIHYVCINV